MSIRPVKKLVKAKPTLEGAGVHLRRAFGFGNTSDFDPFLLLDDFRNDVPEDYLAGFPWHPHRGIETITYVLAGTVEHGDSMGNRGAIAAGDVQWMTAGRGIIHQEMPKGDTAGRMHGFQLWANLPASLKMTAPRYQEVKSADIPQVQDDDGTHVRIVCGNFWGTKGPVDGIAADPTYLDISVAPGRRKTLPVETTRHAFAYVFAGGGKFCNASGPLAVPTEAVGWADTTPPTEADNRSLVLFDRGDEVTVQAGEEGIRFLLVSGKPLEEPVAWYGPIVMNTQEQLQEAFQELDRGTFLKEKYGKRGVGLRPAHAAKRQMFSGLRMSRPCGSARLRPAGSRYAAWRHAQAGGLRHMATRRVAGTYFFSSASSTLRNGASSREPLYRLPSM